MAEPISLFELNSLVKRSISKCLPDEYWVQAELSEVRTNSNGHCYLEFVQKDPRNNALIAKARGSIWASTFALLRPYFEETTKQILAPGIKVLVKVIVEFHELYGYNLTVCDIDPAYTIGDIAVHRLEIIKQLEKEGVLNLNKELELPLLPKRVAVISSATAAGYGDFMHQLTNNPHGYYFHTELFPAIMQGNQVEKSVLAALYNIMDRLKEFDVVVVIRGGGATSDLTGFDTYPLAAACAQFPLPVITGIGHERDDTVLDSVAHTRVKTPTAAAEFLITCMGEAEEQLNGLVLRLRANVASRLKAETAKVEMLKAQTHPLAFGRLTEARHQLSDLEKRVPAAIKNILKDEKYQLSSLAQRITDLSPETLLKRGYSITLKDGKPVTQASLLKAGDELETRVYKGKIKSIVS